MPAVRFRAKCQTVMGERVVIVGGDQSMGAWDPTRSKVQLSTDAGSYPWWAGTQELQAGATVEYKLVILKGDSQARWESRIENRRVRVPDAAVELEMEFDKAKVSQKTSGSKQAPAAAQTAGAAPGAAAASPAPAPAPSAQRTPPAAAKNVPAGAFEERVAKMNAERRSWRNKLDMSHVLLEGGDVGSLRELACLQAYLTWVASGQIKCEEDGGHHRPCAHADASRKITAQLWRLAARGDAERFIARRIFPSLPSYADQFTCSVPMTRIRDIAHRGDIPHDLKQEIKHTLQNKLHRCADPGDLVTCQRILDKVHRENCYSHAFVRELEIFYHELKEFFNAGGLDDLAAQVAAEDSSVKPLTDRFLGLKHSDGSVPDQLAALTDLRRLLAPRSEAEQSRLRLDLELERYAFMLLSRAAGDLEHGQGSPDWWRRLLRALALALAQSELSGIAPEECAIVARELAAAEPDVGCDAGPPAFAAQRVAASTDRALRMCFVLTRQLEEAYEGVPALGAALHIDSHAVHVFVEAEVRTSVLFQASKLMQLAMQRAKAAAGMQLWTAIASGSACGRCVRCGSLEEAWRRELPPQGAVIFCSDADGDEELPPLCRGVVLSRDLPVLSHLALRARQLGVVFACTSETAIFDALYANAPEGAAIRLAVDASGGVRTESVSAATLAGDDGRATTGAPTPDAKAKPKGGAAAKVGELNLTAAKVAPVVDLADSPQTIGAKAASSGKLEALARAGGFMVPTGVAVPFGVMRQAVAGAAVDKALKDLQTALEGGGGKVEGCASAAREAVERCRVPDAVLDTIAGALPAGTGRVAVRSSANSEDLEGVSGAGLHDSLLGVDVKDRAALERAVLQVWASLFTLRAVQSRHAAGLPLYKGIAMGVLVQPMVSLQGRAYAFIAFSKDVVAGDAGAVYVEVCVGLGETLASANEPGTPYRLVVRKETPNGVKVHSLASFSFGLQDAPGKPARVRVDYSKESLSTNRSFLERLAQDIAAVAVRIEEGYGVPMDMEGVVLEGDGGREVHIVQARPIVEG